MRAVAVFLALTLAATALAFAQQQPTPAPEPASGAAPTLRVQSSLVLVPTAVQLKHGDILYGLTASQFVLEDNGFPQAVHLDQSAETAALSLIVVVQCSRSAIVHFASLRGLATMVDALAGGAPRELALVSYGKEPTLLGDFSGDPDAFPRAVAGLQPCDDESAVDTLDAVAYANALVQARSPANRHAILLISETRDHGSHTKPEHLIADLGRSNTVVDSVAFSPGRTEFLDDLVHPNGGGPDLGLLFAAANALKRNVPRELASLSGGEYLSFTSQKSFDRDLGHLANHIHNFYLLSFEPTAAAPTTAIAETTAGSLHRLTVRVPDYPDAILRHRESYWLGPPPASDSVPEPAPSPAPPASPAPPPPAPSAQP